MDEVNINGVILSPLKIISEPKGDIKHAFKASDKAFKSFGEAYFSYAKKGAIKAWKRHRQMSLNIIVPEGDIKFVIYDDRTDSSTCGKFSEIIIGESNYCRLTVPPMLWVGFVGVSDNKSLLLNIADMEHDPLESDRFELDKIEYNWNI